jgi:hypothetical protein
LETVKLQLQSLRLNAGFLHLFLVLGDYFRELLLVEEGLAVQLEESLVLPREAEATAVEALGLLPDGY